MLPHVHPQATHPQRHKIAKKLFTFVDNPVDSGSWRYHPRLPG